MQPLEASQSYESDTNVVEHWFSAVRERRYDFIMAELAAFKCAKNEHGNTALIEAVLAKDEPAVQILAAHEFGCQNNEGKIALEIAYFTDFVGACEILARFELSILHKNNVFLCHMAVSSGNINMVKALSPSSINVINPSTNQTPLDLAILLPSSDGIIEQLVNTSTMTLETLDKACRAASEARKERNDHTILEFLLIFRNEKEARACTRCGNLRRQLVCLATQFHHLYSKFSKSLAQGKTEKLEDLEKQSSSSIEEGEVLICNHKQRTTRGKGIGAKIQEQGPAPDTDVKSKDMDNIPDALSFSLTQDFNKLRNMLPNASFDLSIDDTIITKLLTLSRSMRRKIRTLLSEQASNAATIERLQEELKVVKSKALNPGPKADFEEEEIEIVIKPRQEEAQDQKQMYKSATPQSILNKLETAPILCSVAVETEYISEPKDVLLEEALSAIKAKDLYINFLRTKAEATQMSNCELDTEGCQSMIDSQQEQITHLIDLLYQSKLALERMSEIEIQCSTLEDDNSLLRQHIQILQQKQAQAEVVAESREVKHKGISATEEHVSTSPSTNTSIHSSAERIRKLEATIKTLCTELDKQKVHTRELEDCIKTFEVTKSHTELLKEKVVEQQNEIKRLNDVVGVQQNYLELKEIELSKANKSLEDLSANLVKVQKASNDLAPEIVLEAESTAVKSSASREYSGHGAPRRILRRSNSSRPITNAADDNTLNHDDPGHAQNDKHPRLARAMSAYTGQRPHDSDITIDDLESTPTPVQRIIKGDQQSKLVQELVCSLMHDDINLRVAPLGTRNSCIPTPPFSNHLNSQSCSHETANSVRNSADTQSSRQRRLSNKQSKVVAQASASAANSFAARQALGISMPSNPTANATPSPGQVVSKSMNSITKNGITKLMLAAMKGDLITAKAYIKQDIGLQDSEGRSALFYAAYHNHPNIIRDLIGREALLSTNKKYKDGAGVTALMVAAQEGHKDCIRLLYRVEKDCRTVQGKGCIEFAKNELIVRFIQGLALKRK